MVKSKKDKPKRKMLRIGKPGSTEKRIELENLPAFETNKTFRRIKDVGAVDDPNVKEFLRILREELDKMSLEDRTIVLMREIEAVNTVLRDKRELPVSILGFKLVIHQSPWGKRYWYASRCIGKKRVRIYLFPCYEDFPSQEEVKKAREKILHWMEKEENKELRENLFIIMS